jgi:hypothetical protein
MAETLYSHNPLINVGFLTTGTPTAAASSTNGLKAYMGGAWLEKPLKIYTGGAWLAKPIKRYNGTGWV